MIYTFLIFLHVIVSILLVVVILLQSGRGGGLAGSLGGGISTAMFGGQGADKLMTRLTTGLAATFMILAILISIIGKPSTASQESVVQQQSMQREVTPIQPMTGINLPEAESPSELPIAPPEEETEPTP